MPALPASGVGVLQEYDPGSTPVNWIALEVDDWVPPLNVTLHEVPLGSPLSLNVIVHEPP